MEENNEHSNMEEKLKCLQKKMRVECTACIIQMGEKSLFNVDREYSTEESEEKEIEYRVCNINVMRTEECCKVEKIDCKACKKCKIDMVPPAEEEPTQGEFEEYIKNTQPGCKASRINFTKANDNEESIEEEEIEEELIEEASEEEFEECIQKTQPCCKASRINLTTAKEKKKKKNPCKVKVKKKKEITCCTKDSCDIVISDNFDHDYKNDERWNTGYFRDGVRRVDLVLVLRQLRPYGEALQIKYLMNVLDLGLDLEVESESVMNSHQDLTFIKVHAPTAVLEKYAVYYDMRKFFKTEHMRFSKDTLVKVEADFIKIARLNYPHPYIYSTIERSAIVYRMLRSAPPVGADCNNFGLDSMLLDGIVCDAFALHDGPYFLLPDQHEETINARQALFYSWLGFSKLPKGHPKHLIREYFGERVAFVFAFWEALLKLFLVLSVLGTACFVIVLFRYQAHDSTINYAACRTDHEYKYVSYTVDEDHNYTPRDNEYEDLPICPRCIDFIACPFRNLTQYCFEVVIENSLDSTLFAFFAFWAAALGWFFFFRWWRREEHYMWLWEVPRDSDRNTTRAQYQYWPDTTFPPWGRNFRKIVIQLAVIVFIAFAYFHVILASMIWFHTKMLRRTAFMDETTDFNRRTALILVTVGVINATVSALLTPLIRWLAYKLTALENHRTERAFEQSLMVKRIGFALLIYFTLYYFYGLFKATHYTYPSDVKQLNTWLGAGFMNCGVMGCLYELFVIEVTTDIVRRSYNVLFTMLRFEPSDYGNWPVVTDVPCWEREYLMKPFQEADIAEMVYYLILMCMRSTLMVVVSPLSPLVNLVHMLWDIRSEAHRLLVYRRRPLPDKFHGLGVWRWWLALLPLGIGISNALLFAYNTNSFDHVLYMAHFSNRSYFGEYVLSYFNTSEYEKLEDLGVKLEYGSYRPEFCMFHGKYHPKFNENDYESPLAVPGDYNEAPAMYYIKLQRESLILIFQIIVWATGALLWYIMWEEEEPSDTVLSRDFEDKMRTKTLMREQLKKLV